jgi:hypothetical protein
MRLYGDFALLIDSMPWEEPLGYLTPSCRHFHGGSSLSLDDAAILTHYEVIL